MRLVDDRVARRRTCQLQRFQTAKRNILPLLGVPPTAAHRLDGTHEMSEK
jgi:hypothetical protein